MRGHGGRGNAWKEHAMSTMPVVKRMSVEQAIAAYLERVQSLRYSQHSIARKRGYCRALRAFARDRKAVWLTTDLVSALFAHKGINEEAHVDSMTSRQGELRTTLWALRDFALHGHFHTQKKPHRIPAGWQTVLADYLRFCVECRGLAKSTLREREAYLARFCQFLDGRGTATPRGITSIRISEFLRSVSHLHSVTLANVVRSLKSFFQYLFMSGAVTQNWAEQLVPLRCAQPDRLPAIWRPEEVEALLRAVDRSSPVGKRNFAILLLAARMGMRVGEIRKLRLDHLGWEDATISFVQSKTGAAQVLPLTEEVGSALIDYLRHGRPQSDHREVFLRCRAPFEPFGDYTNLAQIITKYRRWAGIHLTPERKQGMHSLRHTVASRLLETGVGFETISSVLGHRSLDTTREYTRIDVETLRTVALAPEDADHD